MKYYRLKYDLYDPSESTEPDKYMVDIPAFPGCVAWGDTPQDALEILESVVAATIETYIEECWKLPEEISDSIISFRYDLPRTHSQVKKT